MKQLLLPVFLLFSVSAIAQTGPAGVGDADVKADLSLWLDAGRVSGGEGSTVATWNDASAWGNHFAVGNGAVLYKNRVNGKAAFSFNGTSNYFEAPYHTSLNPASYTIFSVSNVTTSTDYKTVISSRSASVGTTGYMLYSVPNTNAWSFWTGKSGGGWDVLNTTSTTGSWAGQTIRYQGGTNGKKLYLSRQTVVEATADMPVNTTHPTRVGAGKNEDTGPSYLFKGDIAEVIIFSSYLNTTKRYLVKNYLSAKYGYTISSNDIYRQDGSANGDYDTDVAGIGQVSSADHHKDSRGTGSVRMSNARELNDNEFLMWGHNNATKGEAIVNGNPAGIDARFARVWRVSETDSTGSAPADVGGVDLSVDLTGVTGFRGTNLRLLIDTNNDGLFSDETPIEGSTAVGDNVYQFTNVTALADGTRFTFATTYLEARDGPGGVGFCNATSTLKLWLDAGSLNGDDNSTVTTWTDRSGKGKHFTSPSGAILKSTAANGHAALRFDGSSQYFEREYDADLNTASFTIFSASQVNGSTETKTLISSRDSSTTYKSGYALSAAASTDNWTFRTGRTNNTWGTLSASSTTGSWSGQVMQYISPGGEKTILLNGSSNAAFGFMQLNRLRGTRVGAGGIAGTASEFFSGDVGEVIVYAEALNSAQRIIVNNFLSAKYGYTLSGGDIYQQDEVDNGDYDQDVAGIGRINETSIHDDAQGSGMVRMRNPRNLDDNEFLFWGHDNGEGHATEFDDVPAGVKARFARVWRVSELHKETLSPVDVGAVDLRWNLTGLGPVTADDLRLLVDTIGDGNFDEALQMSGATDLGNNVYQFTGVTVLEDGSRFTLATANVNQTALPVDVLTFDASVTPVRTVRLEWQTAWENESDYFTVEKSRDGHDWEHFRDLAADGNAQGLQRYVTTDADPYAGTSYYRLRQTDFSGQQNYSGIRQVAIASDFAAPLTLYPNPAIREVRVEGSVDELQAVRIFNALGQDVSGRVHRSGPVESTLVLDLSDLTPGLYTVQGRTASIKVVKR